MTAGEGVPLLDLTVGPDVKKVPVRFPGADGVGLLAAEGADGLVVQRLRAAGPLGEVDRVVFRADEVVQRGELGDRLPLVVVHEQGDRRANVDALGAAKVAL
jgi:hypothetical protein